jgi:hypothetical protein
VSDRHEWAGTGFQLLTPTAVVELADDGEDTGNWGLAFSTGSNGCMIIGSAGELRALADNIRAELARVDTEPAD